MIRLRLLSAALLTASAVGSALGGPCREHYGAAKVEYFSKSGEVITLDANLW